MINFLKEWRVVMALGLTLLAFILIFATVALPYAETKKAVCYVSAQRFDPPIAWRWNPWGLGDGCELQMNGNWLPANIVFPALK